MPSSSTAFDAEIADMIASWPYLRFLDFGAGSGKYGRMIKAVKPGAVVSAVEVEPDYVEQFNLRSIYDHVFQEWAQGFFARSRDYLTDVVIFGDFLEHLTKSDGLDLLHEAVHRCHVLMAVFPVGVPQFAVGGYETEIHRSAWCRGDFEPFDFRWHDKKDEQMKMVLVRGYQCPPGKEPWA
ncbi:MAG TPA: hypothetical protein VJK02_21060 [Anaerolineales bacterium]|nr:hypothetical protein [Anaerolineales bacterium]